MKLYSYWRSSCSYRVRIVLNLKHLAYETIPVHLVKRDQHATAYTEINAMHAVPTLVVNGTTALTQSQAIVEYLEETHPEPALLPRDAIARAHVREICALIANDIQPVQNLRILNKIAGLVPGSEQEKSALKSSWSADVIVLGFKGLEALLRQSAGRYCVGDEVTLADAFLVPQVFNAVRFKVDMTAFPTIARVNAALLSIDAFQAASPARQPDAE